MELVKVLFPVCSLLPLATGRRVDQNCHEKTYWRRNQQLIRVSSYFETIIQAAFFCFFFLSRSIGKEKKSIQM